MLSHYAGLLPRTLWKIFFILNFVTGLVVLYPVFAVLLMKKNRYDGAFRFMRIWARWIAHVPGVLVSIKRECPEEELPDTCIYVANHASYLDIVLSYVVVPKYFVYMGKAEIEKAPLFRVFFRDMNIYVNRKSRTGSYAAYQAVSEKLRKGESVFMYPEGTIESRGRLKPFKNGAFRMAIDHQVPIVPVTFKNNWKLLQNGGFFKSHGRPGIARVTVHKPIPTKGLSEEDLVHLRHTVRETIARELQQA
ncbi:MAG TPA: lysophospholipid acyltransferase family protein [Bacteroidia bacterium]|nr:lysophospholipid acyltransferase family protein [Bacteroidia bacterium]